MAKELFENQMKKEAEVFVDIIKNNKNIELNYTEEDLNTIERIIESDIEIGHPENYPGLIQVLGSYLGETVIRNLGGKWIEKDPQFNIPAVEIGSMKVFPHVKVHKRFKYGEQDSLDFYYQVIKSKVRENK